MPDKSEVTPNNALRRWLDEAGISVAQFTRDTGYRSNIGYLLVSGKRPFTLEALGRVLLAYGPKVAEPLAAIMRADRAKSTRGAA